MRSIVTHAAGQYDHTSAILLADWGTGPTTLDLGESVSCRVILTGTVIDGGGVAPLVIRAGDNTNPALNAVVCSFAIPGNASVDSPVHLYLDGEVGARYITIDPGSASLTGPALLDAYPV